MFSALSRMQQPLNRPAPPSRAMPSDGGNEFLSVRVLGHPCTTAQPIIL